MNDTDGIPRRPCRVNDTKADPWDSTKAALQRDLAKAVARGAWTELRATAEMQRFERPVDLFTFLEDVEQDPQAKNDVLMALVAVSQCGSDIGRTLLYLALWPGLSAIRGRWLRTYRGRREELTADIGSIFMMGIHKLDLSAPRRVAATLCRNTERDLARARFPRRPEARLPPEALVPDPRGNGAELMELCEWVAKETGRNAELVLRVLLLGEPASDVGAEVGLTPAAAWQRIHRLSTHLRRALRMLDEPCEAA